jgi:membrane peptidoglycan carboxypeptidase/UDP-N-acetylmuramyl tripeptide synthase
LLTATGTESFHQRLSVRASLAVGLGGAASWLSRRTGRGDGAIIGGRVALAVDSGVLRELSRGRQVALITGTNGKTTTTHMITAALRARYGQVASNHTGANMPDGHVAALAADRGAVRAVLEVDELHFHQVANQVSPAVLVLLNLSRDQLDRAEEIRRVAYRLAAAVTDNPQALVVANADDPNIVLAGAAGQRVVWVAAGASWRADATVCPRCARMLSVQGEHWWCECGLARPTPAWTVDDPDATGDAAGVTTPERTRLPLRLRVPGAANRGNAAVALATAANLGCPTDTALTAIEQLADIRGRYRTITLGGRPARLLLAKNPAGWQETLAVIAGHDRPLVLAVNAREADGFDTSWLWDIPFEVLGGRHVVASGERATDLAVRLRYADVAHDVEADPVAAVAVAGGPHPDVIANYTAFAGLVALGEPVVDRESATSPASPLGEAGAPSQETATERLAISGPGRPGGAQAARRDVVWRWVRRACYLATAAVILTPLIAFVIGYFAWDVASPESLASDTAQTVVLTYADNSELTRIVPTSGNRTMVRDVKREVSTPMRDATVAAEDPTFYQNPGFDLTGILRAGWAQLTGGSGGGSTLTQQYIKLSTGNDQHTYTRKFKEIVLAFKMSQQQSKDEILKSYLNTAYYGRGAHGIAAAAEVYFHKQPRDLDANEAAVLAGMVQQPTNNDPRVNPTQALGRWTYVADQMARYHFVTAADRAAMRPPETQDPAARESNLTAVQYDIRQQVLAELDRDGISQEDLQQHGYTVVTTVDPRAQRAAEDAVNQVLQGQPGNLHPALVAVDPATGAIRAYYGGGGTRAGGFDYAAAPQQPGSAFKPFVALAGLEQNRGLGELYDGSSPQTIAGTTFANNPGVRCDDPPHCSVREAMTKSVNTVFVNMGVRFGPANVAQAAYQAGIPPEINGTPTLRNPDGRVQAGISLGMYPVRTTDMAAAYATFADNGMRNAARFVTRIVDHDGHTVRDFAPQPQPAFDPKDPRHNTNLAANLTDSLLDVANHSHLTLAGGRPVAGKTGTHQYGSGDSPDNEKAWMVGYTPQISTAVSLSAGDAQHPVLPVRDAAGNPVYGASLPGHIWQRFMDAYLTGQPVDAFTRPEPIGQFYPPQPPPPPPAPAPLPPPPPGPPQKPPKAHPPHRHGAG